jgi:hypothetical protein
MWLLKKWQKEVVHQWRDFGENYEVYLVMIGLMVYQWIGYYTLSFLDQPIVNVIAWVFFLMLFCVLYVLVEPPVSFIQLYHLLCLLIGEIMIGGRTQTNPFWYLFIIEVTLRTCK